ncbi:NADH-quinone oxidoreductase subunit H [Candidatus Bathyarchaeota archaeon A05DMB-2]|jgi:NADH-quinone oxidoreductase subunit H|nr:NADH-quinone oxidoreductase subunit H [Candidatus Bathyarchaeota archaeon A05DMB-2]
MLDFLLIFRVLVFPGFTFILFFTLFCDWVERKIEARMQNRVGPAVAGPAGILQPLADFIKLLTKEEIIPRDAKKNIFRIAPIIAFSVMVFAICFLPIDGSSAISMSGFTGDLIFIMALVTVANFFLFMSGWASSNPYGGIGAARVLTQFLGYDIPLFLLALTPAFLAGSLTISAIAASQYLPFILLAPWGFVLFIIALQAELEKDPFDIPHAESEVVGGLETEYCGGKLAFLHLTRDVQIVLGAALVVELFLGGPYGPVFFGLPAFWYSLWFVLKVLAVVIVTEYVTCLFARLRIDQVLTANWRMLLPLSVLSLALTVAMATYVYPMVV